MTAQVFWLQTSSKELLSDFKLVAKSYFPFGQELTDHKGEELTDHKGEKPLTSFTGL